MNEVLTVAPLSILTKWTRCSTLADKSLLTQGLTQVNSLMYSLIKLARVISRIWGEGPLKCLEVAGRGRARKEARLWFRAHFLFSLFQKWISAGCSAERIEKNLPLSLCFGISVTSHEPLNCNKRHRNDHAMGLRESWQITFYSTLLFFQVLAQEERQLHFRLNVYGLASLDSMSVYFWVSSIVPSMI